MLFLKISISMLCSAGYNTVHHTMVSFSAVLLTGVITKTLQPYLSIMKI